MERKLRVCHVITRMIVGGAQENTLLSCAGLLEGGHDVTLVTGPSPGPEGELLSRSCPNGLRIMEVPELVRELSPLKDWRAYKRLLEIFRKEKFDVVHTHASKAGIVGRLAARKAGVPYVVHTVHGQAFFDGQSFLLNRAYIIAERIAARHCDRIYAVAQAMIEQCVAAKVAPREKYQVVYSGMDLEAFLNAKPEAGLRASLGIPEGAPVVGCIARLFPLKGHDKLIESAPEIIRQVPDVRFLLVGNGILRESLEARIREMGIDGHFVFTGLVSPSEVCRYTALMDVLAHLSLREGLPRVAVQALASGVPVVAYPLDGTPEVVIDGETGRLCKVGDCGEIAARIVELLKDEKLRSEMGRRGQEAVRSKFDWRLMSRILEDDYIRHLEKWD
ncbi:MAG: glycosyltransferase family 4 protein [Victivallales bacterium]|nr:glycosyltransferase family 4 protein [Victivallales bacterium]